MCLIMLSICDIYGIDEYGDCSLGLHLIGLRTTKVATRNFCKAYKLGKGWFGTIYRVISLL